MTNPYAINVSKKIWFDLFAKLIGLVLLGAFIGIIAMFSVDTTETFISTTVIFSIVGVVLILVLIQTGWDYLYLSSYVYELGNEQVFLKAGVISRFERNIPYSRIQHITLYETFWQRMLGLCTISIDSAREFGAGITIPYLSISVRYKPVAGV